MLVNILILFIIVFPFHFGFRYITVVNTNDGGTAAYNPIIGFNIRATCVVAVEQVGFGVYGRRCGCMPGTDWKLSQ